MRTGWGNSSSTLSSFLKMTGYRSHGKRVFRWTPISLKIDDSITSKQILAAWELDLKFLGSPKKVNPTMAILLSAPKLEMQLKPITIRMISTNFFTAAVMCFQKSYKDELESNLKCLIELPEVESSLIEGKPFNVVLVHLTSVEDGSKNSFHHFKEITKSQEQQLNVAETEMRLRMKGKVLGKSGLHWNYFNICHISPSHCIKYSIGWSDADQVPPTWQNSEQYNKANQV